jgi:hypothetical protein
MLSLSLFPFAAYKNLLTDVTSSPKPFDAWSIMPLRSLSGLLRPVQFQPCSSSASSGKTLTAISELEDWKVAKYNLYVIRAEPNMNRVPFLFVRSKGLHLSKLRH